MSIFDADHVGARDFIGATTIDLENRWFNSEWRDMALKPVEMRTLRTPLSKMSQGKLELWVDMMTPEEARQVPTRYRGDTREIQGRYRGDTGEMMTPEEARQVPMLDIKPPPRP